MSFLMGWGRGYLTTGRETKTTIVLIIFVAVFVGADELTVELVILHFLEEFLEPSD